MNASNLGNFMRTSPVVGQFQREPVDHAGVDFRSHSVDTAHPYGESRIHTIWTVQPLSGFRRRDQPVIDGTPETSMPHEGDKDTQSTRIPIWHSPAWIAAIVGLVSVFFTVPDLIGSYLSKRQDIELAKQETEAARLGNINSKQEQEFQIVNNTLANQGTERVFVLRYLAATLDDENARSWASAEVQRLDDLAARQEKVEEARRELEKKEIELKSQTDQSGANFTALTRELEMLRTQLSSEQSKVAELRQNAGIGLDSMPEVFTHIRVERVLTPDNKNNTVLCRCRRLGEHMLFPYSILL